MTKHDLDDEDAKQPAFPRAAAHTRNEKTRGDRRYEGSRFVKCGSITLGCISPEASDCLQRVMTEWTKHKKALRASTDNNKYRPSKYGFAYWLIRWSGLVQPVPDTNNDSTLTPLNQNEKQT